MLLKSLLPLPSLLQVLQDRTYATRKASAVFGNNQRKPEFDQLIGPRHVLVLIGAWSVVAALGRHNIGMGCDGTGGKGEGL